MRNCWSSKLSNITAFGLLLVNLSFGQPIAKNQESTYVSNSSEYLFPIFSGKPNLLAGTMGELRSTHFHAGLDIRTNSITGIPVRAAQKGYVSKILVSTYGYGKAIILTHPDGNQTLYAHLDSFKGALADFVLKEHYEKKSFDLDLTPKKDELPIMQGDTIALSGNTGGSQGPHLHFEIRDSINHALNPLDFHFEEIVDTYPPQASKIALVTLDSNSRINDKFGRFEFYLLKSGDEYIFSKPILATGNIGVELLATDRMNNSAFRFGINQIEMFVNETKLFAQTIDKINFDETRGIQNIFNYGVLKQKGQYFNKLYVDDGNSFSYHEGTFQNGIITVGKEEIPITIRLKDTYGNESKVKFNLKPTHKTSWLLVSDPITKPIDIEIHKNTLKVTAKACGNNSLAVLSKEAKTIQSPSYGNNLTKVYLIDLKNKLPDSLIVCGAKMATNLKMAIPSPKTSTYASDFIEVKFNERSLYDTLYLSEFYKATEKAEVFTIGSNTTPLFKSIEVLLKPKRKYTEDKTTSVYNINGANLGGTWENGSVRFFTRELGSFIIQQDLTPPTITKIFLTPRNARFKTGDNRSGIASFEATLNGEWLLMDYEYKTGVLQAERQDKKVPFKGLFELKVTDNAGNVKTFSQNIL